VLTKLQKNCIVLLAPVTTLLDPSTHTNYLSSIFKDHIVLLKNL